MRIAMMAITTNSSMSVKAAAAAGARGSDHKGLSGQ